MADQRRTFPRTGRAGRYTGSSAHLAFPLLFAVAHGPLGPRLRLSPKITCRALPTGLAWRPVTDQEFLRKLRRYARKRGQQADYLPDRGKGSHAMIRLGARTTSVQRGELGPGLLRKMLRDLDIDKRDF